MSKPNRHLIWLLVASSAFVFGGRAGAASCRGCLSCLQKGNVAWHIPGSHADKAAGRRAACRRGVGVLINDRLWAAQIRWRLPGRHEAGTAAIASIRTD